MGTKLLRLIAAPAQWCGLGLAAAVLVLKQLEQLEDDRDDDAPSA